MAITNTSRNVSVGGVTYSPAAAKALGITTSTPAPTKTTNYPSSAKQVGATIDSGGNIRYSSGSSGWVSSPSASEIVTGSGAK